MSTHGLHNLPRTSHKKNVRKLEVALKHERSKFATADQQRKAALYDLAEERKKVAALKRKLEQLRGGDQPPLFPGAA